MEKRVVGMIVMGVVGADGEWGEGWLGGGGVGDWGDRLLEE